MDNNSSQQDIFVTSNQAARILNVSLATLKKFIYQGKIKTVKTPGGHHRILRSSLFFLQDNKQHFPSSSTVMDRALFEISEGFIKALAAKKKFCHSHANSVANISLKIGNRLRFSHKQKARLNLAALLHDVGMLGISGSILNKPVPLTEEEHAVIKNHPLLGAEFVNRVQPLKELSPIIKQHHERVDGKGYPFGLKEDEICQEAKIIGVAEAFDSMTAKDSYRNPLSEEKALFEVEKNMGGQFDPCSSRALIQIYGD